MTTLHIEHPITDFELWQTAFARFASARAQSGVRAQRVHRPLDDPATCSSTSTSTAAGKPSGSCGSSRPRCGPPATVPGPGRGAADQAARPGRDR